MSRVICVLAAVAATSTVVPANGQTGPVNGMRPADLRSHAIVGATVHVAPGRVLEDATIVIRRGTIEAVGPEVPVPADARVWDAAGLTVYAGLIEPAVLVEADAGPRGDGTHWNPRVRPELALAERSVPDRRLREELRKLGFTAAAVYPEDGIFRGSGVVVALAEEPEHVLAYRDRAAMAMSFNRGGGFRSGGSYPGSLMGALALVRQVLHDARWHEQCRRVYAAHPEGNEPPARADALLALEDVINGRQAVIADVTSEHDALRAARVAREFDLDMMLLGDGNEFRWLPEIVAAELPLVVPLRFPKRPELDTLSSASNVTLRDMMTWEQAPTNPRRLIDAGATVALTTHRLKSRSEFRANLRKAIQVGLDERDALAALTTTPAAMLGLQDVLGTIETGKVGNLVVVDGTLFDKAAKIRSVWVNGRRHEITGEPSVELVAAGRLETDLGLERSVTVDTKKKSVSIRVGEGDDQKKIKAKKVVVQQDQVAFVVEGAAFDVEGYVRLSGVLSDGVITGTGLLPAGERFTFSITPTGDIDEADEAGTDTVASAGDAGSDDEAAASEPDAGADAISGDWSLSITVPEMPESIPGSLTLALDEDGSVTGSITAMETAFDLTGRYDEGSSNLAMQFEGPHGTSTMEGRVTGGSFDGTVTGNGLNATVRATRSGAVASGASGDGEDEVIAMPPDELVYPLGAFGLAEPPAPETVLITGATIWTCGSDGILENADLLVSGGKIRQVGTGLSAPDGATVIDGTGKHVTPGLIDCHSHTGIHGGVNEFMQTNTAEVRIADCINPDDINWYRQLAGGLTACNQLHGSANPIGGQNSVVKLKWGSPASAFPVKDAIGGIKFALGENVKRSENRYPDTRMGVETFIRDAFTAATEYEARWHRYLSLPTEQQARIMPPRRDLELDTLVEIIAGDRLVHCHSYRQDEILMLIRVADDFGFTIGTFQHVLEGYKVAEAIAKHGAGGSSFSDWWAYKMEVIDAIPYNGALMTEVGVVVSFNSDSSELARRMNTEAAKAVRYGGMDPHEALKLVTLNPARQLQIDHRTGSLEAGKDADFAIWSADPLSTYARCEQTWIEGARYFSLEQDMHLRQAAAAQRQRLEQKILAAAHGKVKMARDDEDGADTEAAPVAAQPARRPTRLMARLLEARQAWMAEQVRLGHDPDQIRPGRCACNDVWWMLGQEAFRYAHEEMDR